MGANDALRRLVGGLLVAAGFLIALSCGLCTGFFGIMSVVELFRTGDRSLFYESPVMLVGALATVLGAAMVWAGLKMTRRGQAPPPP